MKIQTAMIQGAEGRLRATRLGTTKMPEPMMVPDHNRGGIEQTKFARQFTGGVHVCPSWHRLAEIGTLPLHPARAVALEKTIHFVHRGAIEIAHEGVLQAARRHRELERLLVRRSVSSP